MAGRSVRVIPRVLIVPGNRKHAKILAKSLRPEDVAEIKASGNYTPKAGIIAALNSSHVAYTVFFQGQLAAMFGAVRATSESEGPFAIPWLLTGLLVNKYPKETWLISKKVVEALLADYGMLANMVDSRHLVAVNWLKRLGFELEPPIPYGPFNVPFHRAVLKRRPHV